MNLQSKCMAAALMMTVSTSLLAGNQIEDVRKFFVDHIDGKKFVTETHGTLPSGSRYDFFRTLVTNNIQSNGKTMSFDITWSIRQDLFDRLPDGTFSTKPINKDRVGVSHCQLAELRSTKEVTGYCTVSSNTSDLAHSIKTVKVSITSGKLKMVTVQADYADLFGPNNSYVPGRSESVQLYYKNAEGKTVEEETYKSWVVNPTTLEVVGEVKTNPTKVTIGQ